MDAHSSQLMKHYMIDLTSTFFVSFISDISKAPLRLKVPMKQKLRGYFSDELGEKEKMQWIQWMLQCRKDMDRSSRNIMTRLALALVVKYGHDSSKKCGRIQHEKEMKEKEDTKMEDDDDE